MNTKGQTGLMLADLLKAETIELNLKGNDRDAVLKELINRIPALAENPDARATLLKALQEREQLHSTGIGDGIALPHARNALVGLVNDPVIVFGRHSNGVPYGAIDNKPTRLFFLLVATNVSQHLQILARISRVLRDLKLRQGLLLAEKPVKAIELFTEAEKAFLS